MVIESSHEKTEEAMCKLLQSLFRSFVISIENLRAGFQRCYDQMVDISIDVPQAYNILERWVLRCRQVTWKTKFDTDFYVNTGYCEIRETFYCS